MTERKAPGGEGKGRKREAYGFAAHALSLLRALAVLLPRRLAHRGRALCAELALLGLTVALLPRTAGGARALLVLG